LEQVAAVPSKEPVKLRLLVPADEVVRADTITAAIRSYFEKCRGDEQRRMSTIFWEGRIALIIGLAVVLVGNVLGQSIRAAFTGQFAVAVANGLEIFGWVAMWKPAELLLYDWIPVRRKRNLLARLASMDIEFRPKGQ
jgi:hypothetical protein